MPTSAQTELQGRMHSEDSQGPGLVYLPIWNPGQQPGQCPFCSVVLAGEPGPHWAPRQSFPVPSASGEAKQHKSLEVT